MGLTLSYGKLREPAFQYALKKLSGYPFKSAKVGYAVVKIVKAIEKESRTSQDLFISGLKQYAKLDEKGELAPHDGRPGTFEISDEKQDDFRKWHEEFDGLKFDVEWRKLHLNDLDGVGLSASELIAIEDLVDTDEAATDTQNVTPLKTVK